MLGSLFDFSHHTNIQSGCSGNTNPLQLKTWLELGALQTACQFMLETVELAQPIFQRHY